MPKKSVREMNQVEREHYSLRGRLFHAVLAMAIILSIAAVGVGFYLYASALRQQYTEKASDLAKTFATLTDTDEVARYTRRVREIYDAAPEELRAAQNSEYDALFADVADEGFKELAGVLADIRDANNLSSIYVGISDETLENFIFVINSDSTQDFRRPGRWMYLGKNFADAFAATLETFVPAIITKQDDGNYVCTGSEALYASDGALAGSIVVNISLAAVQQQSRVFLRNYCLLLLVIAVVLATLMVQRLKKTVVKPINELTEAAKAYIEDKKKDGALGQHFSKLHITSGDEIENLSLIMADMETDLADYIENLTAVTAEKERVGAELSMAASIQAHMLPNIFPAFPSHKEFDLYATMDPAKEVGGDFYDFFMVGDDHLAMVVADVSGKGVPAALFSMIAKTMLKTQAQTGLSPDRVLMEVNASLSENNDEDMFVTVWLGVLEISTGELTYADAGHEKLLLYQNGEWKFLPKARGPALAMFTPEDLEYMDEKYRFRNQTVRLGPGDAIFQYTDGVTEATDADNELFGDERLLAALNSAPSVKPEELLPHVRAKIDAFVKDAPQFDDITMLELQYKETKP